MAARAVSPKENERHLRSRPFGTLSRYRVRSYLPLCFRSPRWNTARGFSGNTQKPQPPPPHPPTFPGDVPSPRTTLLFPYPRRSGPKPGRSCAKLGPFSHVRPSSLVFRIRSKKPIRSTPTPGTPRLAPHTAPPWGARGSDLRAREWDPTGCYWFSSPAVAVVQIGVSSAREDDEEKSRQKQKSSLEQDTTVPGIH